jgi:hypothetical protein
MDEIILRSFCTGSKLRAMLDRDDISPVLATVNAELEKALETKTRGPVDFDVIDLTQGQYDVVKDSSSIAIVPLRDETILAGLHRIDSSHVVDIPGWEAPTSVVMTSGHLVRGALFTTKSASQSASKASSILYFKPTGSAAPIPGQIESAFSVPFQGRSSIRLFHFFVVRRYKVRSAETTDIFLTDFPGFGARIYSKELSEEVEVVRDSMAVSHAWQRSWDDDHMVTKSMNRVSRVLSNGSFRDLTTFTESSRSRGSLVAITALYCHYC